MVKSFRTMGMDGSFKSGVGADCSGGSPLGQGVPVAVPAAASPGRWQPSAIPVYHGA